MKKTIVVMLCAMALACSACGGGSDGGGGGDAAEQAAQASYEAFGTILESCIPQAQVIDLELEPAFPGGWAIKGSVDFGVGKVVQDCTCPGGGTLTLDTDNFALTATQCKSTSGLTYTGTLSSPDGGQTIEGTMSQFGECSNMTADGVGTDACTGTVSGTCAGVTTTCTVSDPAAGATECVVTCS